MRKRGHTNDKNKSRGCALGKLYVDCYRAFGGFHGTIGAKDRFTLPLAADTEVIALYRNENAYQTVLEKDAAGNWQRVAE